MIGFGVGLQTALGGGATSEPPIPPVNLFTNPELLGAVAGTPGTPPTNWPFVLSAGVTDAVDLVDGSNEITFTVAAARQMIAQSIAAAANSVYNYVFNCVVSSTFPVSQCISIAAAPAGATTVYKANGVPVTKGSYRPQAGDVLSIELTVLGTAGNPSLRIGAGVVSNQTGSFGFTKPRVFKL